MTTATASRPKTEELSGEYSSTRFCSDDGTFVIGLLADGKCVLGNVAEGGKLLPGGSYRFLGKWVENGTYGRQFKFAAFVESTPHTYRGVIEYLLRYTEKCGIGRAIAHQIIDKYGAEKAIAALKRNPSQVAAEIPRLAGEDARAASQQLIKCERFEQTKIDLLDLLAGRGFPGELIDRCLQKFGVLAPARLRRDPYTLLVHKMPGCGFARVDSLYCDLGLPADRLKRQVVCAWHWLREESFGTGSSWHRWEVAESKVGELISGRVQFRKAVQLGLRAKWVAVRDAEGVRWLAAAGHAADERDVCGYLKELCA